MTVPVYFETCWSIMSTNGIVICFLTACMMGMYSWNRLLCVPLVVSSATAIANGLCYYAYYSNYPQKNRRAAAAIADVAWLVEEAGLSFYSCHILRSLLTGRKKMTYHITFFSFSAAAVVMRVGILLFRQQSFAGDDVQSIINGLHMGYFLSIACMECVNALFLINKLGVEARVANSNALYQNLIASSEVRMASLCVIGAMRTVTYYFQSDAQAATNVASELDRFVSTLETLFPCVMLIDYVLTRKTAGGDDSDSDDQPAAPPAKRPPPGPKRV